MLNKIATFIKIIVSICCFNIKVVSSPVKKFPVSAPIKKNLPSPVIDYWLNWRIIKTASVEELPIIIEFFYYPVFLIVYFNWFEEESARKFEIFMYPFTYAFLIANLL